MKFRTAFLFLAVLLCAFLPALAEENPLLGDWQMTRYCAENIIYEDPAAVGSRKSILFSTDGTAEVTINGTVYPATWTQEGVFVHLLYADGDRAEFIAEPDLLIYATGNQVQHFTKNTPEATATPKPAAPAIAGTWKWKAPKGIVTLTIRADGTSTLNMGEHTFNFQRTLSGSRLNMYNKDMSMQGTYTGSAVHLGFSGLDIKFTR